MSSDEVVEVRAQPTAAADAALILVGFGLLLWRVVAPPSRVTPFSLAAVYAALFALSLTGVHRRGAGRIGAPTAAALGGVAVLASRVLADTAVPPTAIALPLGFGALAAVAEEAFFRRLLFARLEAFGPAVAIAVSASLFAAVHVPAYGWGAFPIDLAAGVLFSWQRWASGSWLAPASTHVLANVLAVIR